MFQNRSLYVALAFLFVSMILILTPNTRVQAQVSTICFYEEVEGEINNANPSQSYIFTATGQHTITIEMEVISGTLDPYLEVYSESTGQRLSVASNIMLGDQPLAKIFNLAVSRGDYEIIAGRVGGERGSSTGTYRLILNVGGPEIMEEHDGNVTGGGNLFDGDTVRGYIADSDTTNNAGESDRWFFDGRQGNLVSVVLSSEDTVSKSHVFSLFLFRYEDIFETENARYSSNLAVDWVNDNPDPHGIDLRLSNVRLPQDGRYVLVVRLCYESFSLFDDDTYTCNDNDISGDTHVAYTMTLLGSGVSRPEIECIMPVSTINLMSAPLGELGVEPDTLVLNNEPSTQGRINDETPISYFVFASQQGDLVTVTMNRTSDDLIPLLGVQDSNGDLLDRETADLSGRGAVMNFLVPETGWYILVVTREDVDEGTSSGSYHLQFTGSSFMGESAAAPNIGVTATVARSGQVAEGDISDDQVTFYYLISLERDEEITLTMRRTTGDLEPVVAMMDTELSVIERGRPDLAGRTSTLTFTAPTRGWYVIAATRDNAEAGTSAGGFALHILVNRNIG